MIMVQAAGFSDIGKVRKANEDCFLLNEPNGLYVVADGMGGHRAGGVASRIAVETIDASMAVQPRGSSGKDGTRTTEEQSSAAKQLLQGIFYSKSKNLRTVHCGRVLPGNGHHGFPRSTLPAIPLLPPMWATAPFTCCETGKSKPFTRRTPFSMNGKKFPNL